MGHILTARKKKKKSHSSAEVVKKGAEIAPSSAIDKRYAVDPTQKESTGSVTGSPAPRKQTEAEKRYEEVQKRRVSWRVAALTTA